MVAESNPADVDALLATTCPKCGKVISDVIKENDFENSQLFRTNLKNIDFRTCNIGGIIVGLEDIKGMIVNNMQAIQLSKLLGIVIK